LRCWLEVRESSAINAALCDLHLGRALLGYATTTGDAQRRELLQEAAEAGRGAMAVITPDLSADYHALAARVVREAEAAAGE
jgi:hypothetical protein